MPSAPDAGLRKLFHDRIGQCHFQSIEIGTLGRGVPDDNYCADGVEGWIEYKFTETHAVGLRPEQVGWILRRMRAGGRVFVVTMRQHGGGVLLGEPVRELWIHEGWDAAAIKAGGLMAAPPVLCLEESPWDWGAVRRVLTDWWIAGREVGWPSASVLDLLKLPAGRS